MKMLKVDKVAREQERLRSVAIAHACAGNAEYASALMQIVESGMHRDVKSKSSEWYQRSVTLERN